MKFLKCYHTKWRAQTLSCNHCMQRAPNLSSKNPTPNWLANKGIYSIIASRTLQCLSSASSTMAGNSDWDNRSIPITCKNSLINIWHWNVFFGKYIYVGHPEIRQKQTGSVLNWYQKKGNSFQEFISILKIKTTPETKTTWFTWSSLLMMFRRTSGNSSFRRDRKIGRSCSIVASCIEDKVGVRTTFALKASTTMIGKKNAFEDNLLLHKRGKAIINWKSKNTRLVA